jgi:hypothetical protein
MISSYLLILVPVISIIYFGLRAIFKFKTKNKYIGLYAGALWVVTLIVLIVSSVKIAYEMRSRQEIVQSYKIEKKTCDTLYVDLFSNEQTEYWNDKHISFNRVLVSFENKKPQFSGLPKFSIEKNENNFTEFSIVKTASGINDQDAIKYAKNIEYEWQQDDSLINLRRYFQIKGEQKIRNQRLNATLKIPVGKIVYLGKKIDLICSYIENYRDYSCDEMAGHYWIMTEEGLKIYGEPELNSEFKNEDNNLDNNSADIDTTKEGIKQEIEDMKAELDSM